MATKSPLYMGFDLSTQQLKGIVVDSNLELIHEAKVDFDEDFGHKYGVQKGVLTNPTEGEVFAPPAMWLDALNLVLDRLRDAGNDFTRIKGVSGAGMQHGTVFWSGRAEHLLETLDAGRTLTEQLEPEQLLVDLDARKTVHEQLEPGTQEKPRGAFAHPVSPNWQDASTQKQCDAFDGQLGDQETLAKVTGSKAHHRFSGPQILRYRTKYPEHYKATARISLVSSFLASVFLGRVAPIDISDVTGMNLWDLNKGDWDHRLLELTAGSKNGVPDLKQKLGEVSTDGGASFGAISPYFSSRYHFSQDCQIIPFTGDNPSTILSLPLRASDAMVSLGTSTTFLMSTPHYKPDPAYHFMNHPTTKGLYMFMLCYKNGSLAREEVRDALNASTSDPTATLPPSKAWDLFNSTALSTPPLSQSSPSSPMRLGLYFPRPEIVPRLPAGQWRRSYDPASRTLSPLPKEEEEEEEEEEEGKEVQGEDDRPPPFSPADARSILESQLLSLRLRSHSLVRVPDSRPDLPAQPRRIYLVGGASANPAIARLAGQVLGSVEGVYRLDIGGNACALGAGYKAVWGCERGEGEGFEELIGARWDEGSFVERIAGGYEEGTWERYGEAVEGFERMEREVLGEVGEGRG